MKRTRSKVTVEEGGQKDRERARGVQFFFSLFFEKINHFVLDSLHTRLIMSKRSKNFTNFTSFHRLWWLISKHFTLYMCRWCRLLLTHNVVIVVVSIVVIATVWVWAQCWWVHFKSTLVRHWTCAPAAYSLSSIGLTLSDSAEPDFPVVLKWMQWLSTEHIQLSISKWEWKEERKRWRRCEWRCRKKIREKWRISWKSLSIFERLFLVPSLLLLSSVGLLIKDHGTWQNGRNLTNGHTLCAWSAFCFMCRQYGFTFTERSKWQRESREIFHETRKEKWRVGFYH